MKKELEKYQLIISNGSEILSYTKRGFDYKTEYAKGYVYPFKIVDITEEQYNDLTENEYYCYCESGKYFFN